MNLLVRTIILVSCVFTFLNALAFVGISVYRSGHAYWLLVRGEMEERPGVHLVEALDGFLLAFMFLIFAIGFGKLFLPDHALLRRIQIAWLQPKSFSDLKHVLWEAVLTTLVVLVAITIVEKEDSLQWTHLVAPAAIALIAVASRMLKGSH